MKPQSIKRGSVTVKVYETPTGEYKAHTVRWSFNGKLESKKFGGKDSKSRAVTFATEKAVQLANGETVALKLTDAEVADYAHCKELLKPLDIPLLVAVTRFVEEHLEEQNKQSFPPFPNVADNFIIRKKTDGTRSRHLKDICTRIAILKPCFSYSVSQITSAEINKALDDLQRTESWTNRTRNHYRAILGNCLNYAKAHGMLPRDWNEFEFVPKLEERDDAVTIYTPEEAKLLLWHTPKALIPSLVLLLFSGIRHSEVQGTPKDGVKPLDWRDVDLNKGHVFIAEGKVRTAGQRFAHLPENAVNWLRSHWKKRGPLCPQRNLTNALVKIAADAGVEWRHNAPRHSYISYRLAVSKDLARVSTETGTSPVTLTRRYRRPIPEGEAEKYFSLNPPPMARVVNRKPEICSKSVPKVLEERA